MRRASFITKHLFHSQDDLDENGNYDEQDNFFISPPTPTSNHEGGVGLPPSKSFSGFFTKRSPSTPIMNGMTSRPSFISLMLIASDDELSRLPRLPAPLQVETDTYQKCGFEDEPKNCSHLPILHPPSENSTSDDEGDGLLQTIIHLPERIRKISADKQRFNVYALADQDRKQLKNLYVF